MSEKYREVRLSRKFGTQETTQKHCGFFFPSYTLDLNLNNLVT